MRLPTNADEGAVEKQKVGERSILWRLTDPSDDGDNREYESLDDGDSSD